MARKICILNFFLVLFLCGCAGKKQMETISEESALTEYVKTGSKDFYIENVSFSSSFYFNGLEMYCVTPNPEGGYTEKRFSLDGQKEETVFDVEEGFYLCSFFQKGGALTILSLEEEKLLIGTYLSDGKRTGSVAVPLEKLDGDFPFFACETDDGQYVLMTHSTIFLINALGDVLRTNSLQEETISRATQLSDGSICLAYGHLSKDNTIAFADNKSLDIFGKTHLEFYPSFLSEKDGSPGVSDGNFIYVFDWVGNSIGKYCDLGKHYLKSEFVRNVFFENGKMSVVYWDNVQEPEKVRLIEFCEQTEGALEEETGKYDEAGKRIIYVYCPNGEDYFRSGYGDAIREFNLENSKYSVKLLEKDTTLDVYVDTGVAPDIYVCGFSEGIVQYAKRGYLEDLWPYIDNSQAFEREDFTESVKKLYETEGHLYGITNALSIKGIRVSDVGDDFDGSFTAEEYVEWLSKNEDLKAFAGMSKSGALSCLIHGAVIDFVDFDTGKAFFDSERFVNLLKMTERIVIEPNEESWDLHFDMDKLPEIREHPYFISSTIGSVWQMAQDDTLLGRNIEYLGYPSDSEKAQGIITSLNNVAIVAKSDCKDGAYEFIEYWLKREEKAYELYKENPQKYGCPENFSSLKSLFEEELNAQIGKRSISLADGMSIEYEITKEYIDKAKEMIENARPETYEQLQIREIVAEELDAFFAGTKDAETTAEIIQNRVQLYLDEIG